MTTIPTRPYGPSRIPLSTIGFGGIVVMNAEQEDANRAVARAIERGINYFDVAPSYGDAEHRLGPALAPYRKKCFLACKTEKRDAAGAKAEMARSFDHLQTDYFDLFQLHAIKDVAKDVDAVFAPGGAMELLLEMKKSGRIRHIGFSAHSIDAALAALDRYDFDSVLVPVNFASWFQGHFGPTIVAKAQQKGASILALKAMARQSWPDPALRKAYPKCWYQPLVDPREQELAVRFTLSQPVVAAIPPGEASLFWRAVDIACQFTPLTPGEGEELRSMAESLNPVFRA